MTRAALLVLLMACGAAQRPVRQERPGLLAVTARWSGPDLTVIRGWSRARGAWIERRATRPGEYVAPPPRALRLLRFAAYAAPEQVLLDERATAWTVAMVIRPAWLPMVRVGGGRLR